MEFDSKKRVAAWMRALVICLFLTHTAASDSCFTRVACGEIGISRADCETKGCCYDDTSDAVEPRCFSKPENFESCDALTLRASCRTYEEVTVVEREISTDAYGDLPEPNVPSTDAKQRGEVIVEVTQTEGSGQLLLEDATASIEETVVDQRIEKTTVVKTSEGHGYRPDGNPESMSSMQSEESTEVVTHIIHGQEGFGEHPEAAPGSLGSMQSEEFTEVVTHVIPGEEGFGEHLEAAPGSLGSLEESDAPIEELETENPGFLKAALPSLSVDEFEDFVESPTPPESGEIDEPEVSFAYGSVGAPASMMELEHLKVGLQAIRPPTIYKTKAEEMPQMPVQRKERAEIYRPRTETICTQSSDENIERLGWLVLVNSDEPIELFTFKKESSDDSSKIQSGPAHSVSPLKSPTSHYTQASIKDALTTTTTEHLSEFSSSSSDLKETDPAQAELDGSAKGKANGHNRVGHKNGKIFSKKSTTHLNCAITQHIPCGNGRMTKRECREQGCCWKSLSRNLIQAGCYLPQSEAEANTFHREVVV